MEGGSALSLLQGCYWEMAQEWGQRRKGEKQGGVGETTCVRGSESTWGHLVRLLHFLTTSLKQCIHAKCLGTSGLKPEIQCSRKRETGWLVLVLLETSLLSSLPAPKYKHLLSAASEAQKTKVGCFWQLGYRAQEVPLLSPGPGGSLAFLRAPSDVKDGSHRETISKFKTRPVGESWIKWVPSKAEMVENIG